MCLVYYFEVRFIEGALSTVKYIIQLFFTIFVRAEDLNLCVRLSRLTLGGGGGTFFLPKNTKNHNTESTVELTTIDLATYLLQQHTDRFYFRALTFFGTNLVQI
eukprot:TRINITY_DN9509_c0_g3_i1.p6 TRINITY_DN9509_c0_g3~~TRINITY_DN9509_c0_g3_i1.p6  ORF type:complete len:104 (-),score=5.96 TRINITY_DN9509_c0_g3_i1:1431-1742(-)